MCVLLLLHCEGCRAGISFLPDQCRSSLSFSGMLPFGLRPLPLLCRNGGLLLCICGRLVLRCLLLHANCTACFCGKTPLRMGWFD